jgi:hypothetical protein
MNLEEIGRRGVEWIQLAQNRQAVVNVVMKLPCSGAMELGTGGKLNEIGPYRNIVNEAD